MPKHEIEKTFAVVFAALLVSFAGITASMQATASGAQDAAIEEGHKKMTDKIREKDPNLPVVATGTDLRTNTLIVVMDEKATESKEVYENRVKAEVGDIPVRVAFGNFEFTACTSRTAQCTMPMVGAVRIQTSLGFLTLTKSAERTNGQLGFLTAGHGVGWGNTGGDIGQSTSSRKVGDVTVNPSAGSDDTRYSDALFSDLDSGMSMSIDRLYRTSSGGTYTVDDCLGRDEIVGNEEVWLHGYVSGIETGGIIGTNWSVSIPGTDDVLAQQYITNGAVPALGDSGGALTSPPSSNIVDFYGLAAGQQDIDGELYGVFSPWNAIRDELGLKEC